jgi:hypothetical protein
MLTASTRAPVTHFESALPQHLIATGTNGIGYGAAMAAGTKD